MILRRHLQSSFLDVVARLPQNALSRAVGRLSRTRRPKFLARAAVAAFAKAMQIATDEAEEDISRYASVHDFFVRRLKRGARKIDARAGVLVSPSDGVLGEFGPIERGRCIQAKGRFYSVEEMLGDTDEAKRYALGGFATIYLSPRHYHRVHSPASGEVFRADHIAGCLLPVNMGSINKFDGVFVKNERLVIWLDTEAFGRIALVMVGATCVGEMTAAFDPSLITNRPGGGRRDYDPPKAVAKGSELGVFHMGSTVVLFLEHKALSVLDTLEPGAELKMGQALMQLSVKEKPRKRTKR